MHNSISINIDSFSSGQVSSKIWLAEYLENSFGPYKQNIWILGGWYGLSAFILFTRGIIDIEYCRSFDIDPTCESVADTLMNNWVWQKWKFKAFTADCNKLNYTTLEYGPIPSLIINTSCEHFEDNTWFNSIPPGTNVALQSNNMNHDDHTSDIKNLEEFKQKYPLSHVKFAGTKTFQYPNWEFDRYMIIGRK